MSEAEWAVIDSRALPTQAWKQGRVGRPSTHCRDIVDGIRYLGNEASTGGAIPLDFPPY